MKPEPVVLAAKGLPWRSFGAAAVVFAIGMIGGTSIFGSGAQGGVYIVSALFAAASFAAML